MNGIKIGCWNFPGVVNDPLSTCWLPKARVDPTWISSNGTWTGLFWFLFAIKLIWDWYETLFWVLLFRDYYVLFTFSFWKCSFLKVLFKWPCVTSQITCNLQITPSKLVILTVFEINSLLWSVMFHIMLGRHVCWHKVVIDTYAVHVFSLGRFTSWTFFVGFGYKGNFY